MDDLKEAPEGLQEHPTPGLTPEEAAENTLATKELRKALHPDTQPAPQGEATLGEYVKAALETAKTVTSNTQQAIHELSERVKDFLDEFQQRIAAATDIIGDFIDSDLYQSLEEVIPDACSIFDVTTTDPEAPASKLGVFCIVAFIRNLEEGLLPYIRQEAETYQKATGQELTAAEFFRDTDPATGAQTESIYYKALHAQEVFELPQVQTLAPSELEAITPYLQDACYTYLTDTGIMTDVITGDVSISDLADWTDEKTGKAVAEEIIERAQIMTLEAAGAPSGGDLLRELNAPGTVKAIFPQKHDVPNNRFANMLTQLVKEGEVELKVNSKPAIYSTVEVTALDSDGVKLSRKLSEYERQVMEAFCTVWKYGHPDHIVTPNIIYRAMTHNPTANFSDKDRDDILAAVEVLTGTKGKIDITQEAQFFNYDVEEPYIKGYILDLLEGGGVANGKRFVKWYIKEEPLVSQYATLAGNQRLTIPGEAYNVTYLEGNAPKPEESWKPIHNSKDRIAIKGYMLRRIYQMRYDESRAKEDLRKYEYRRAQEKKKKGIDLEEKPLSAFRKESRRISYSTVFEVTGLADKRNNSLAAHKQYMKCCLDYWKQWGYISDYHLVSGRSKGSVEAVDVTIDLNNKHKK